MAIVYCDLVNGIDWYTQAVYAAGTTYAQDALVIPSAASGLTSVTARVWKSLQNGNTGNALVEGAWWTLVADGSAAKPFKTVDDATRGLTGADEWRCAKTADGVALSGSYTFIESGTNAGKVTVAGNNPDGLAVNDYIGNMDIGIFRITNITGTTTTVITISPAFYTLDATANITPVTTYKYQPLTITATQNIRSGGTRTSYLYGSGGWNISDPANPVRDGYTRLTAAAEIIKVLDYTAISYFHFCGRGIDGNNKSHIYISHCISSDYPLLEQLANYFDVDNCLISGNILDDWVSTKGSKIRNSTVVVGYYTIFAYGFMIDNCRGRFGLSYADDSDRPFIIKNSTLRISAIEATGESRLLWHKSNVLVGSLPAIGTIRLYQKYHLELSDTDVRIYTYEGNIFSDESVRYTASGIAWRLEPSAQACVMYPCELQDIDRLDAIQVAVSANSQVTATIWCKKSDADSAFEAQFICKGGQLAGITNDVTAVATDSTDWQQLTIQVTPTEAGVLRFGFQVWGSATATCHIDDFEVSQ